MSADRGSNRLQQFFAGLAEQTFEGRLGIADPPLVDYLAELLTRFVRSDALCAYRSLAGRRLVEVTDMLAEAEARVGTARREIHRHIGDYTLFWTGVYPEALPRLQADDRKDRFIDYCALGKRAYGVAAKIPVDEPAAKGEVLERLSHEFETCIHGLAEVRREWERRDPEGPIRRIAIF